MASASHELRTPLTSILGYLELVLDDPDEELPPQQNAHLGVVRRNSLRLLTLVGDLLTVNQLDTGNLSVSLEPVPATDLLRPLAATFGPLCAAKGLELRLDHAAVLPTVLVDRHRMEQVLANLVSNAVKFVPAGGCISVTAAVDGDHLSIEVADTGVGITAEELPKVFDRFFRSASSIKNAVPGTGLGLAIAKAMVEAHGGQLSARSQLGEGTTFLITLPLPEEQLWPESLPSTTTPTS